MKEAPFHFFWLVAAALHLKPSAIAENEGDIARALPADKNDNVEIGPEPLENLLGVFFAFRFGVAGQVHGHPPERRFTFEYIIDDEDDRGPGRIDFIDLCREDHLLTGNNASKRHDIFDDGSAVRREKRQGDDGCQKSPSSSGHWRTSAAGDIHIHP
jgi:hypothetical protein